MTPNQKYALIDFLVAFYGDVIPVRSFTPVFYADHELWLMGDFIEPFAKEGLGGIDIDCIAVMTETYKKERNDYLS